VHEIRTFITACHYDKPGNKYCNQALLQHLRRNDKTIDLHFNGGVFLFMSDNPPVGASFSETKKPGPNILRYFGDPAVYWRPLAFCPILANRLVLSYILLKLFL
jgi:hypothetical protein